MKRHPDDRWADVPTDALPTLTRAGLLALVVLLLGWVVLLALDSEVAPPPTLPSPAYNTLETTP